MRRRADAFDLIAVEIRMNCEGFLRPAADCGAVTSPQDDDDHRRRPAAETCAGELAELARRGSWSASRTATSSAISPDPTKRSTGRTPTGAAIASGLDSRSARKAIASERLDGNTKEQGHDRPPMNMP